MPSRNSQKAGCPKCRYAWKRQPPGAYQSQPAHLSSAEGRRKSSKINAGKLLPALLSIVISFRCAAAPADSGTLAGISEYDVKAAFVYNFLKFIELPQPTSGQVSSEINLCVYNSARDFNPLAVLEGKTIADKLIKTTLIAGTNELPGCDTVFILKSEEAEVNKVLQALAGKAILSVGEVDRFCERGGIINLYFAENKVRFAINAEAARAVNIRISSKLLRLAASPEAPAAKIGEGVQSFPPQTPVPGGKAERRGAADIYPELKPQALKAAFSLSRYNVFQGFSGRESSMEEQHEPC